MNGSRVLGIALLLMTAMTSTMASASDPPDLPVDPADGTSEDIAHDTTATPVDESGLAVVLVMGEQPGPGLWKVSSGNHVLWILGEVSPIPRKVQWKSRKFDARLRGSQELLLDLSGYWRASAAEMDLYDDAAKLPRGTTLRDVIPPGLHARVRTIARRFGAFELDELRPFAATNRLVISAMRTLGLRGFSARHVAEEMADKHGIRITTFAAPEPPFQKRVQTWSHESNVACLERVADALEDGGTGVKQLANAWSVGEIDDLRRLVPAYSFSRDGLRAKECAAAMRGGEQPAREYDLERKRGWMKEAERALRENRSTMAVVLMTELFATDGYLAALRAKGYEVVEPQ
jgi:hypothetical protein